MVKREGEEGGVGALAGGREEGGGGEKRGRRGRGGGHWQEGEKREEGWPLAPKSTESLITMESFSPC